MCVCVCVCVCVYVCVCVVFLFRQLYIKTSFKEYVYLIASM